MKPVLLVDVDGVLLKWNAYIPEFVKGTVEAHSSSGMKQLVSDDVLQQVAENEVWIKFNQLINCTPEKAIEMVSEYNATYGEMFPAYADAKIWMYYLAKRFDIIAVTCFGGSKELHNKRYENLKFHFGKSIKQLICLPYETGKKEALLKLSREHDVVGFIDDRLEFLNESYEVFKDDIWHLHMIRDKVEFNIANGKLGRFVPVSDMGSASIILITRD